MPAANGSYAAAHSRAAATAAPPPATATQRSAQLSAQPPAEAAEWHGAPVALLIAQADPLLALAVVDRLRLWEVQLVWRAAAAARPPAPSGPARRPL